MASDPTVRAIVAISILSLAAGATGAQTFAVRDKAEFEKVVAADATLEKIAGGFKFVEGPVWVDVTEFDGEPGALVGRRYGYLVFSDIPDDRLLRCEWSGRTDVEWRIKEFRKPSRQANGNTVDGAGRLITCEHETRRVTVAYPPDREAVVLTDQSAGGLRFNSPNDVAVKSDGSVWFTDPPYGGHASLQQDNHYVFRYDPQTKQAKPVATVTEMPHGLCFSPDETKLYVADSGRSHDLHVFDVKPDGTLGKGEVFATIDTGGPDGIRCDAGGRVWSSAGDGVHVFAPDGKLLGKILVPESPANLCFGGMEGTTLFITARTSLYAIPVKVAGAHEADAPK